MSQDQQKLDIIIPIYNEEESLLPLYQRINLVLNQVGYDWRIIFIDDGSTDQTPAMLVNLAQKEPRITVIQLSRNFGHQAALCAGLDASTADVVITLDGDGQHPPEYIPAMLQKFEAGCEIVQTQRNDSINTSIFKRNTSKFFYWLINTIGNTKILPGTADFRLMSKNVVQALCSLKEYHKFLRGMVPWLGYETCILPYEPEKRIAGKSKYTLAKMFNLAENAIFSFSLVPLRLGLMIGVAFFVLALIEAIYVLTFWLCGTQDQLSPGWSSIIFVILITGGSLMVMISLVGIYIGQIHQEVKQRPLYIIRKIYQETK